MKIPEPLKAVNDEFISIDDKLYLINVELIPFNKVDVNLKNSLNDKLAKDNIANIALDTLGIFEPSARLEKYVQCNYGGFDNQADLTSNSQNTEYFDCGDRGHCPGEGKLCKALKVKNGVLTPREIDIIRLIGKDKMDKEIADILGITKNTATTHRQNITRKLGGLTKAGIAAFAIKKNII